MIALRIFPPFSSPMKTSFKKRPGITYAVSCCFPRGRVFSFGNADRESDHENAMVTDEKMELRREGTPGRPRSGAGLSLISDSLRRFPRLRRGLPSSRRSRLRYLQLCSCLQTARPTDYPIIHPSPFAETFVPLLPENPRLLRDHRSYRYSLSFTFLCPVPFFSLSLSQFIISRVCYPDIVFIFLAFHNFLRRYLPFFRYSLQYFSFDRSLFSHFYPCVGRIFFPAQNFTRNGSLYVTLNFNTSDFVFHCHSVFRENRFMLRVTSPLFVVNKFNTASFTTFTSEAVGGKAETYGGLPDKPRGITIVISMRSAFSRIP